MNVRPVTLVEARRFVAEHHRHNKAPRSWRFGVGVELDGELVGLGMAGRPVARHLDDGRTIEITRCCLREAGEAPNAASMIYGRLCRAAKALGFVRAVTYTLEDEPASSVRAAGFMFDGFVDAEDAWARSGRARYGRDLFGDETRPVGRKRRWVRELERRAVNPVDVGVN